MSAQENDAEMPEELPEAHTEPTEAELIETLQQELAEAKDQILRALAETENVRRRGEREREETSKYAITGFARDMVTVLENLHRATSSITPDARAENDLLRLLGDGVDMVLRDMTQIFERHGIRRLDPKGEKFDHNFHQAVSQIETADAEPGTILQVLACGYVIKDRLLQPAMVVVSTKGNSAGVDTKA